MTKKKINWSKTETWTPREEYSPSSLEELQTIIKKADVENRKIRVVGSLHSFCSICNTSDIQILTDKLNRVLSIDKSNLLVKVEGGIKIKDLIKALVKQNLTLINQGYITKQSLAGALSTATHGTGHTGTLASQVESLELVDAQGKLWNLSAQNNPHLFHAALVNLGCLGVIYSITLRCIPQRKLKMSKQMYPLGEILKNLNEWTSETDFFQIWISPDKDKGIVFAANVTQEEIQKRWLYKFKRALGTLLVKFFYQYSPSPQWLFYKAFRVYGFLTAIRSCVDYSENLLSPADEGIYVEEEIALSFEHTEKGIQVAKEIVKKYPAIIGTILVRFTEEDEYGYLSPSTGRKTAYVTLICLVKKGYQQAFEDFENALLPLGGRPHWGKINTLTPEKIAQLYGKNYERFLEARQELDPEGIFSNDYIETRLTQ